MNVERKKGSSFTTPSSPLHTVGHFELKRCKKYLNSDFWGLIFIKKCNPEIWNLLKFYLIFVVYFWLKMAHYVLEAAVSRPLQFSMDFYYFFWGQLEEKVILSTVFLSYIF